MSCPCVRVGYRYVNDLYFRTRNAKLRHEVYELDFMDWVKSNIAYNILGKDMSSHKVSKFCQLYLHITEGSLDGYIEELRDAVLLYYSDLFQLYQDHLTAQLKASQRKGDSATLEPHNLVLLPSFDSVPDICELIPKRDVEINQYRCAHLADLLDNIATIYASEDSTLFKCMSLYFDLGRCKPSEVTLVGVTL